MKNRQNRSLLGLIVLLLIFTMGLLTGCHEEKVVSKKPVVVEKPAEEEVFKNMEEKETAELIEKVRTYAESFDIGTVDKAIKDQIKIAIPKGTKEADAVEPVLIIVDAYMEEALKAKIAEGLNEYVGRHTEEDILMVYDAMNTSDLIEFIMHYEIERLKLEGYLR